MKKILILFTVFLAMFSGLVIGESRRIKHVVPNTSVTAIVTNTTLGEYSGYLESVYVDIPAASTCTVTIATADETLLTLTGITADAMYRPRYTAHSAIGGVLAIATNDAVMKCLAGEKLTVIVNSNSTSTNDATLYITTKE